MAAKPCETVFYISFAITFYVYVRFNGGVTKYQQPRALNYN